MNDLRIFDPFNMDTMDEAVRQLMRPWRADAAAAAPRIKIDVTEQEGSYVVKAEIPGVRKEDIDVRIEGSQVTISAEVKHEKEEKDGARVLRRERHEGYASRSFTLDCAVDEGKSNAKYENGVLELMLPKMPSSSSRRLSIQ